MTNYSLTTKFVYRKALRFVIAVTLMFVVPLTTVGCIQLSSGEYNYEPSPSGKYLASLLWGSTDLMMIAHGETLSENAKFRLRRSDGSILKTIKLAEVGGVSSSGFSQILWSNDEKYVACEALGAYWIIDVLAKKKHRVECENIISIRWRDDSTLVFVKNTQRISDRARLGQSVHALSLPSYEITLLVEVEASLPSYTFISNYNNQLSPNAEFFIHFDMNVLSVTSLKEGITIAQFPLRYEPEHWWWNEDSSACLLLSGGFEDRVFYYDLQQDTLSDISDQLRNMSGVKKGTPHPPIVGRVWGSDGRLYLVTGVGTQTTEDGTEPRFTGKDWICLVDDGSSICVQDEIGDEFMHPSLSPTGDLLALEKDSIDTYSNREIFVCSVKVDLDHKITLGQPKKLHNVSATYFWSPNGEKLFIRDKNKFISINKEQMQ